MSLFNAASLSVDALLTTLDHWVSWGWLRSVDRALVHWQMRQQPNSPASVLLLTALASHQVGRGHVCLDLTALLRDASATLAIPPERTRLTVDHQAYLPQQLLAQSLGTHDLQQYLLTSLPSLAEPLARYSSILLLDEARLYLRRYFDSEQRVAAAIHVRMQSQDQAMDAALLNASDTDLRQGLQTLFTVSDVAVPAAAPDWQRAACAIAARRRFSIITGGPGTGKTTTVVRLLALLQTQALQLGAPLRIKLAAPTGKAAARLTESIGRQRAALAVSSAVREAIPSQVSTLHRLLGSLPDTRHFRHHAGNRLALDVLVIDEASMIDLDLMDSVLAALPSSARLILLGDKDQLASVEAGAVLGELCLHAEQGYYDPATLSWLSAVTGQAFNQEASHAGLMPGSVLTQPLAQHTVMLRQSRRFGPDSGIGRLAQAVNRGDVVAAKAVLASQQPDVQALALTETALTQWLLEGDASRAAVGYRAYLHVLQTQRPALHGLSAQAAEQALNLWAQAVLLAFDRFRLLCAVHAGPAGVDMLNLRIAQALQREGLLTAATAWYEGRPVMMTRNDYALGLMNGDIGIALHVPSDDPDQPDRLRVVFPRQGGGEGESASLHWVLPSRLDEAVTVFAMTVHKAQGSEFEHTALLLPPQRSPVLTREWIYTGITRAQKVFTLLTSSDGIWEMAMTQRVQRASGLRQALDRLVGT
ncbi:exodeoxyribonuclease V subunit alpha [Perlucidibaca aquatica]|uniref:exodeoxyribonuclease V subunit alpha n=1 Tax=Perlucidibaca aquatica TaxID=1852776 RepID=UPI000A76F989|nr:exodeoxyribonuclease V subunit alpha [Perlucidibaca aquatica]